MSVFNSPSSPSSDHIRHLLHQRTAPALATHGHFPSETDVPDSPSIYSHSQFTPRPLDKNESPYHFSRYDSLSRSPVVDRARFNHANSSILSLHDDPRSSYASSSTYDQTSHITEYSREDEDDPEHRMSMLGIKMRFHSKAPWELGGDDIVEEDEGGHAPVFRPSSHSKRSLKSFGSSRRPSGESNRSGSVGKKSSDSSSQLSARGAMHNLTQASMSVSSLVLTPPPSAREKEMSLRQKLSLPRLRTRSTSNSTASSFVSPRVQHNAVGSPRPSNSSVQDLSPLSRTGTSSPTRSEYSPMYLDTRSVMSRSPSPVGHPYANPEHACSFVSDTEYSHVRSDSPQEIPMVSSNDSHATLTTRPTTCSMEQPPFSYFPTPPAQSSPSIHGKDRPRTRDISAPIPLSSPIVQPPNRRETKIFHTSLGSGIAGWQEPQPSTFALISLEEARAQRSRTLPMPPDSAEAFPQVEQNHVAPSGPTILTRPRGRSTSIGGKSKNDSSRSYSLNLKGKSEPTTPNSAPSQGKNLKHKKSGFMRMFGGKEKDCTPMPSPPPTSTFFEIIPPVPRTPKVSTHRVPVPSVSPKHDFEQDSACPNSPSEVSGDAHLADQSPSPKRITPSLSVNTTTSAKGLFGGTQFSSVSNDSLPPAPSFGSYGHGKETLPQSAPPGTTDFIGLRLRPVSAMFSSHFTDHLLDPEALTSERGSEPSLISDSGTRSTTVYSDLMSPLSPDFSLRGSQQSGVDKLGSVVSQDEGQSEVVRALQDQISSAKKAWQRHIWELEGQVRDLKTEVKELRQGESGGEYCGVCGRGHHSAAKGSKVGLLKKRPSAQTALSSRLGSNLDL